MCSLKNLRLLSLLVCTLGVHESQADYFRDSYRDTRLLGRGNAGIADVSGGIAAFYNPAGLVDTKSFSFMPVDLNFGGNQNIYDAVTEFTTLTSNEETLGRKFSPFLGKPLALQGTFFPHVALPGVVVGYYNYLDVNMEYRDPVFPRLDLDVRYDKAVVVGFARNLTPKFSLGTSMRYMKRQTLIESLNMATVFNVNADYLKALIRKGEIWTFNLGARYRHVFPGDKMWFAWGLVVENVGYPVFKNDDRSPLPERQAQKINMGLSYGLNPSPSLQVKFLFDLKEIDQTEKSYTKRIFMGTDVELPSTSIRAGLFQGYWTLGLTTKLFPLVDLDAATYAEEMGSYAGIKESRYWMLGLRIGLDAKSKDKKKQKFTLDHL